MHLLQERTSAVGRECKRFLTALAYERAAGDGTGVELDTTKWDLQASTPDQLREVLQTRLLEASARVSDLYQALTEGSGKSLTKNEFLMAMFRIGFTGEPEMIQRIFGDMDVDESGTVSIDELCGCTAL